MFLRKSYLILAACALLALSSCRTDKGMVEAKVIDTGDITYQGCGYVLQLVDKALLQPLNLPSAYHHDGMRVKMKYKHTGIQDTCAYGTVIYDLINIEKIRKIN